jgi:hypothetical protein
VYEWLSPGFGLEIGFIEHFNTRLVTTFNYIAIVDLHNLHIPTAHAKYIWCVLTSRSLVTAYNSGDSFNFRAHLVAKQFSTASTKSSLHRFPYNWLLLKKSKLRYDRGSVGQSILVSSTHFGPKTRFLFLSDSCWFVDVGRPLWREDGSIFYNVQYIYILHIITWMYIYNMYKASVSPGPVQQIMPSY